VRQSCYLASLTSDNTKREITAPAPMETHSDPNTAKIAALEKSISSLTQAIKTLQVKNGSGPSQTRKPSRRSEDIIDGNINLNRGKDVRRRSRSTATSRSSESRPRQPSSSTRQPDSGNRDTGNAIPPPRQRNHKRTSSTN
jgi:hypothetical protein